VWQDQVIEKWTKAAQQFIEPATGPIKVSARWLCPLFSVVICGWLLSIASILALLVCLRCLCASASLVWWVGAT
jgi:hypothetical protein